MSRAAACVSVIVPGLAGPATAGAADEHEAVSALLDGLELPGLARLLRDASVDAAASPAGTPPETLAELAVRLLGIDATGGLPAAALARADSEARGDVTGVTQGAWLRADPVHLRADMAKLVLFPPEALSLSLDHAARLVEWLNGHEHFPGPPLEMLSATCWVCPMGEGTLVATVAPAAACGSNAHDVLPTGADAGHWNRRMNEIQMLLHECPVNEEREREGLAPVNSVWFWGGGTLPEVSVVVDVVSVSGDDPVLAGAARLQGVAAGGLPADAARWCGGLDCGHHLLALDALELPARGQDLDGWRDALATLDATWFEALANALSRGGVSRLRLHTGDGVVDAGRSRFWQRWRRGAGISDILTRLRAGSRA